MTFRDCLLLAWRWLGALALCAGWCALVVINAFLSVPILIGFVCEEISDALKGNR